MGGGPIPIGNLYNVVLNYFPKKHCNTYLAPCSVGKLGGCFQICFIFTHAWGKDPIFIHIFQVGWVGWFNHHPGKEKGVWACISSVRWLSVSPMLNGFVLRTLFRADLTEHLANNNMSCKLRGLHHVPAVWLLDFPWLPHVAWSVEDISSRNVIHQ